MVRAIENVAPPSAVFVFFHHPPKTMSLLTRLARPGLLLGVTAVAAALLLGCAENGETPAPQQPQPGTTQTQGQPGQMKPGGAQLLSPSEISDEQLQKAARIAVAVQQGTRQERMQFQKEMREKYGNPQQLDSAQKAKARKEIQRRQMKMQKKQMKLIREEAKEVGMDPKRFLTIMRSVQKDSTLQKRLQAAMKAQMKKQAPQPGTNQ